ncbi:MAG: NADH-quinone oxidoreductase subunit NuoE [Jatrophihabitantaceae bacterium]
MSTADEFSSAAGTEAAGTGAAGTGQDRPRRTVDGRLALLDIERPGNPALFGDEVREAAAELVSRYPAGQSRSALLPMLHLVQSEQGYVTPDGIAFCADVLGLTKAQVAAVATFYTMYKRQPTGEYLVSVCTNTLCGMLGGDEIYRTLSELLGVGMNQTAGTPGAPGSITLEHAECLAACDYAPVVTVNYEFFDNQTPESAVSLVNELRGGNRPLPSRGAPLCGFREISRQIAGFADRRPESRTAGGTGAPTEVGVRLARQRGDEAPGYGRAGNGSTAHAERAAANNTGARTGSSAHDEPLETSRSNPAAGSRTGGQSERIEKGK